MTTIAWAIVFIGLIFYDGIWKEKLDKGKPVSGQLIVFCFIILILCTIRELAR